MNCSNLFSRFVLLVISAGTFTSCIINEEEFGGGYGTNRDNDDGVRVHCYNFNLSNNVPSCESFRDYFFEHGFDYSYTGGEAAQVLELDSSEDTPKIFSGIDYTCFLQDSNHYLNSIDVITGLGMRAKRGEITTLQLRVAKLTASSFATGNSNKRLSKYFSPDCQAYFSYGSEPYQKLEFYEDLPDGYVLMGIDNIYMSGGNFRYVKVQYGLLGIDKDTGKLKLVDVKTKRIPTSYNVLTPYLRSYLSVMPGVVTIRTYDENLINGFTDSTVDMENAMITSIGVREKDGYIQTLKAGYSKIRKNRRIN